MHYSLFNIAKERSLFTRNRKGKRSLVAPLEKSEEIQLEAFLPEELKQLTHPRTDLPRIAKDQRLASDVEAAIQEIPTRHSLYLHETRDLSFIEPESVHLVVTSTPSWTPEPYGEPEGSEDPAASYEAFLQDLDRVWKQCFDTLVQGGRLICVVGDICLSRRKNAGRHVVVPLHAAVQEHCRALGYDNLAPIIWHKKPHVSFEEEKGSMILGKPYEPNAVIKNDIEYILMERKPGGYRSPSMGRQGVECNSGERTSQMVPPGMAWMDRCCDRKSRGPFPP